MTDLIARLQSTLGDAYRVDRELGGGGMSRVFVAEESSLRRAVVVKVLSPELSAGVNQERFQREIQLAAKLQHACIVPVLSAGDADGMPYYTMPYVEGDSLRARLAREGRLPIPDVVRILRDVAEALSYAHERGIVHRDIKPDNVMLTRHHALVTDFGVAKAVGASTDASLATSTITGLGTTLGTPAYMAPEQAVGDPTVDHRADLYALGLLGYEMLTGEQLFSGRSPQRMIAAHISEQPAPVLAKRPDTPRPLATLVMRLLAKSPSERPRTAEEVLQSLDAVATPSSPLAAALPRILGTRRRRVAWLSVALIIVVAAAVLALGRGRAAAHTGDRSVAVLPFVNLSGDPQNDYLGDGMSEELIAALSRVQSLKVAARTSSFAFRGQNQDIRTIAGKIGVTTVLAGSVRRAGNHLRVSAELTSASNGFNLWSETFDRDFTDVFAVQDEIARAIVSALGGALGPQQSGAPRRARQVNADAYDAYLKGLFFWNRRGRDNLDQAVRYFNDAIAKDSGYAPAYAGLAETYRIMANWSYVSVKDGMGRARKLAERAVALDDSSAEAHSALADILCQHDYDFTRADAEYQRAIALNPGIATTRYFHAWCISPQGRFDEALAEVKRALALDPLNSQIYSALGRLYYLRHEYDAALAAYHAMDSLPDVASRHAWQTLSFAMKHEPARAVAEGTLGVQESAGSPLYLGFLLEALVSAGQRDSAQKLARHLIGLPNRPTMAVADYYALTGDRVRAFAWLDSAYAEGSDWLTMISGGPEWDPYRDDPRFVAMLRKVGLPDLVRSGTIRVPMKPQATQ